MLDKDNIGFKLLKKAGWKEGAGLGADQQGITTPLQAWQNDGRKGIGSRQKPCQVSNKSSKRVREVDKQDNAEQDAKTKSFNILEQVKREELITKAIKSQFYRMCKEETEGEPSLQSYNNSLSRTVLGKRHQRAANTNPLLDD